MIKDLWSHENHPKNPIAVRLISNLQLIFINLLNKWILLQFLIQLLNDFQLRKSLINLKESILRLHLKHKNRSLLLKQLIKRILMKKLTINIDLKVLDNKFLIIIIILKFIYMMIQIVDKYIELDVKCVE